MLEMKRAELKKRMELGKEMLRAKEKREKERAAAEAAAARAKAEESEEEAEQQPMDEGNGIEGTLAEALNQIPVGDPEPAVADPSIFIPQPAAASLQTLDLRHLTLPVKTERKEKEAAFQQMLAERSVLYCTSAATPALLQLLFQVMTTPGLASLTLQGSQQLAQYYSDLEPGQVPVWAPSYEHFYNVLCRLGYRGVSSAKRPQALSPVTTTGAAAAAAAAAAGVAATPGTAQSLTGQAVNGAVNCDVAGCLVSLRSSLALLVHLCAVHSARDFGIFDNRDEQAQEAFVKLVLALAELQLCPQVALSMGLIELANALSALINSWGHSKSSQSSLQHPSTSQQQQQQQQQLAAGQSSEGAWGKVAVKAAQGLTCLGPSHRARAHALCHLPVCSEREILLQQLMSLQLMKDVAATWKVQQPIPSTGDLGNSLYSAPLQILKSLSPSPVNLCASVLVPGTNRTDFQALLTLFDCTSMVLKPLIYQHDQVDNVQIAAAHEVFDYISSISNGLNKTRDEVAVRLCTRLSSMHNALEFGLNINIHDMSHAG